MSHKWLSGLISARVMALAKTIFNYFEMVPVSLKRELYFLALEQDENRLIENRMDWDSFL